MIRGAEIRRLACSLSSRSNGGARKGAVSATWLMGKSTRTVNLNDHFEFIHTMVSARGKTPHAARVSAKADLLKMPFSSYMYSSARRDGEPPPRPRRASRCRFSKNHVQYVSTAALALEAKQNSNVATLRTMPRPKATGCILWLHDLGEHNPREFADHTYEHIVWCGMNCPSAERRLVTVTDGKSSTTSSWFEEARLPVRGDEERTKPPNLGEAIKFVHSRLDFLEDSMQLPSHRLLVAGFGQGGALAIAAGLSYGKRLAGILSHSGWVVQDPSELRAIAQSSPNAKVTRATDLLRSTRQPRRSPRPIEAASSSPRSNGTNSLGPWFAPRPLHAAQPTRPSPARRAHVTLSRADVCCR